MRVGFVRTVPEGPIAWKPSGGRGSRTGARADPVGGFGRVGRSDEVSLRRKRYNLWVCMGGILESIHARGASNVLVDLREVVGHIEAQSILSDGRRVGRLPTRTHGRDGLQVCLAIPQGGIKDAGEPSTAHVIFFKGWCP